MIPLDTFGSESVQRTCSNRFVGVTTFPVLTPALTERSETAAMGNFSGICAMIM